MDSVMNILKFIVDNGPMFLSSFVGVVVALVALLHAVIALFVMIPGAQPEGALQKVVDKLQSFVDFVSKISKK